jgi:PPK2 family polyphosphate:nucleotide phosphotransferase
MVKKKTDEAFARRFRVPVSGRFRLRHVDPSATPGAKGKGEGRDALEEIRRDLIDMQEVLYAQSKHAVLVVLQAMDTGGKDSTIRRVFGPLNPQGVRVTSFKAPTKEELAHDYLWRVHRNTPRKGIIGVFNRSHYEDVLVVRVHKLASRKEIDARYEQINAFEKHLVENGTTILKFFLHISKDEQKERLQSRLDRPDKHWKFNKADLEERKLWPKYMKAAEKMLSECSTRHAPWYIIPADRKWYRNLAIARILRHTMRRLKLRYPKPEEGLDSIVI